MRDGRGKFQAEKKLKLLQNIVRCIKENPNLNQKEIAKMLGISTVTMCNHVKQLRKDGVIGGGK